MTYMHMALLGVTGMAGVFGLIVFFSSWFTIHTKQAGIIERFGKFNRIATEGLNFKLPLIESLVYIENLNMQLMDIKVNSKTKDDATLIIPVRIQYYVLPQKVKEAYYELDNPEDQIKAHVENLILGAVPKMDLDETYKQEDVIARQIKLSLSDVMSKFGYSIENALVIRIVPAQEVVNAMNEINAARRQKVANEAKAESERILLVGTAEGEKQAQILAGEGVAGEQKAIVEGLKESFKDFEEGTGLSANSAMMIIMMARYFDALKEIGANNTTILMPHSPSAVADLYEQLRQSVITGNLVGNDKTKGA